MENTPIKILSLNNSENKREDSKKKNLNLESPEFIGGVFNFLDVKFNNKPLTGIFSNHSLKKSLNNQRKINFKFNIHIEVLVNSKERKLSETPPVIPIKNNQLIEIIPKPIGHLANPGYKLNWGKKLSSDRSNLFSRDIYIKKEQYKPKFDQFPTLKQIKEKLALQKNDFFSTLQGDKFNDELDAYFYYLVGKIETYWKGQTIICPNTFKKMYLNKFNKKESFHIEIYDLSNKMIPSFMKNFDGIPLYF